MKPTFKQKMRYLFARKAEKDRACNIAYRCSRDGLIETMTRAGIFPPRAHLLTRDTAMFMVRAHIDAGRVKPWHLPEVKRWLVIVVIHHILIPHKILIEHYYVRTDTAERAKELGEICVHGARAETKRPPAWRMPTHYETKVIDLKEGTL